LPFSLLNGDAHYSHIPGEKRQLLLASQGSRRSQDAPEPA
jgi:hypothetical protein